MGKSKKRKNGRTLRQVDGVSTRSAPITTHRPSGPHRSLVMGSVTINRNILVQSGGCSGRKEEMLWGVLEYSWLEREWYWSTIDIKLFLFGYISRNT